MSGKPGGPPQYPTEDRDWRLHLRGNRTRIGSVTEEQAIEILALADVANTVAVANSGRLVLIEAALAIQGPTEAGPVMGAVQACPGK